MRTGPGRRILALAATIAAVGLLPAPARAGVATSCSFDAATATASATIGSGDAPVLVRSGDEIWFNGSQCGIATRFNTDTINVSIPDLVTSENPAISIAGGQFEPGLTSEADGSNEIEIALDLHDEDAVTVIGSAGPDVIHIGGNGIDLVLGSNPSEFEVTYPTVMSLGTILSGDGNDDLRSDAYKTAIDAGAGDDTMQASVSFQVSTYDGGSGADSISYAGGVPIVVTASAGGSATVARGSAPTIDDSVAQTETITGSNVDDVFYGSADADHFIGGAGVDWFYPGGGDDTIEGGNDLDILSAADATADMTFDLVNQQLLGAGTDAYSGIEIVEGSPQRDVFEGDGIANGTGAVLGGGGHDVLTFAEATTGQTVYLAAPDSGTGAFTAVGIWRVIGSAYPDTLMYDSGDVRAWFSGRGGRDHLVGGPLDDHLLGGDGRDAIDGGDGTDTCRGGTGTDVAVNCEP